MPASDFQKDDLIWLCLKKNTAFIKKFNGITLTKEPMNLTGLHCKRNCGLTSKAVGISASDRHIVLVKKTGKSRNPKKSIEHVRLCGDKKTAIPKLNKVIGNYRPDLVVQAQKSLAIVSKQSHTPIN